MAYGHISCNFTLDHKSIWLIKQKNLHFGKKLFVKKQDFLKITVDIFDKK
jgi:hypothetical protein